LSKAKFKVCLPKDNSPPQLPPMPESSKSTPPQNRLAFFLQQLKENFLLWGKYAPYTLHCLPLLNKADIKINQQTITT